MLWKNFGNAFTPSDAEQFQDLLQTRLQKFGLELHPEKTCLLEFGRFAKSNRRQRGQGKPETFDFLGLTHYCSRTRKGWFDIKRRSSTKRLRANLTDIKMTLRRRLHVPPRLQGQCLQTVVRGWFQYHAVPFDRESLDRFQTELIHLWHWTLRRRSYKGRSWTWSRMQRPAHRWIPPARILHPHRSECLIV